MITNIQKPRKTVIPLAEGLSWGSDADWLTQRKMDGEFSTREVGDFILAGEQMPDGRFVAFDCLQSPGGDVRGLPLRETWGMMVEAAHLGGFNIVPSTAGHAGAFLAAILAEGGEGIVRKRWDAPYGEMLACKRNIILKCVITGFVGGTQSVTIADATTGQPRGKCALRGGKCDQVKVGSVIRVEALEIHEGGKLREPRTCTDWLVKF